MAFKITYKRIFEVEFQHDFYLNKGSLEFESMTEEERNAMLAGNAIMRDIEILVPEDTKRIMQGLKLILKQSPTGFFVGGEVEENGFGGFAPKIAFPGKLNLRFAFRFNNPYFLNFTNLNNKLTQQHLLYFDNRLTPTGADPAIAACADFKGPFPHLSLKPHTEVGDQEYALGDLVSSTQADLEGENAYKVKMLIDGNQDHPNQPAVPVWQELSGKGYVNGRDMVQLRNKIFTYTSQDNTFSEVNFTLLTWDGKEEPVESMPIPAGETKSSFQLDLSALPSGKYVLRAMGKDAEGNVIAEPEESCIYIDNALLQQRVHGLFDIFYNAAETSNSYSLLQSEKKQVNGEEKDIFTLLTPKYQVHFKNRETFWRFIFNKELSPATKLGELVKDSADTESYVTQSVKPLTKQFSPVDFNGGFLLPNPGVEAIKIDQEKYFSDIYIYN